MFIIHVLMNVMFFICVSFNIIMVVRHWKNRKLSDKKVKVITSGSFLMGIIVYITYIVLLIVFMEQDGYDKQTLSLLILSWAFMYATNCILSTRLAHK